MGVKARVAVWGGAALAIFGLTEPSPVLADGATTGLLMSAAVTNVSLARGASQSWTWDVPRGSYLASARISYSLYARAGALGQATDGRIYCHLFGDGSIGTYDEFTADVQPKQIVASTNFSDASRSDTATIEAPWANLYNDLHVTLECTNNAVMAGAAPAVITRAFVVITPVPSITTLAAPSVRTVAPPSTAASSPPPAPVTTKLPSTK
jgi:hypothetical protein